MDAILINLELELSLVLSFFFFFFIQFLMFVHIVNDSTVFVHELKLIKY